MSNIESPAKEVISTYYNDLFTKGKLVNLNIGKWSMQAPLLKDDLPMSEEAELPNIIKLGNKLLVKPEVKNAFIALESKARSYLERQAFPFHVTKAYFVPTTKFIEVYNELLAVQKEYYELVEKFFVNYALYRAQAIEAYPAWADKLQESYPPEAQLRPKFYFHINMFEISMPSQLNQINLQDVLAQEEAVSRHQEHMNDIAAQHKARLDEFLQDTIKTIRSKIIDTCSVITNKYKRGDAISKANVNSLKRMITDFKAMNFLDDRAISAQLESLEKTLEGKADFKADSEQAKELNNSLTQLFALATADDSQSITGEYYRKLSLD